MMAVWFTAPCSDCWANADGGTMRLLRSRLSTPTTDPWRLYPHMNDTSSGAPETVRDRGGTSRIASRASIAGEHHGRQSERHAGLTDDRPQPRRHPRPPARPGLPVRGEGNVHH